MPISRSQLPPRLLRVKAAAAYLGVSSKALRQLIRCGQLSYVQLKPNSPFLLDIRDLEKFIEARKNCA